jgi:hypothetical protein
VYDPAARLQPPASCPGKEPRLEPTLRSPAQDAPATDWADALNGKTPITDGPFIETKELSLWP